MTGAAGQDWNPGAYARFRGLRLRPFLYKLDAAQAQHFTARYDSALADAYPVEPDGRVWFSFKRVFFLLTPEASA